jgi:phosphohistidine phosphatase
MKEVYLIRHGLAGTSLVDKTLDEARSLSAKGKERMKAIANFLKNSNIFFNEIFTSPLARALETAEIVRKRCSPKIEIIVTDLLAPNGSYLELIKFLNFHKKANNIAIVGHEPFLSGFASFCLTKRETSIMNFKKGGVMMLETEGVIKPGTCQLSWLLKPKLIIDSHE